MIHSHHRSTLRALLMLLVIGALVAHVAPPATAQAKDPIKVGVLMPLTTPLAFYGTPQLEAVKMAIEAANGDGGIKGRPIELVIEDSNGSNTAAVNGLNRILQAKPVAVIGPILTTQNLAILPQIDKIGMPLLNAAAARKMTQQGSPNLFRFAAHDAIAKEAWTRFVVDTLGKKRIGIVLVANEWGYSGRDETAKALDQLYKMKLASIATYQITDKDMTGQLVQMQKDNVDVILVQGHPADETLIAKQIRQLNITVPRLFSPSICIAYARGIVDFKDVEDAYCETTTMLPAHHSVAAVRTWAQAFKKRLGADKPGNEPDGFALHYYELARALVTVLRQHGTEAEQIKKGLREIKFESLSGAVYRSDKEGNMYHEASILHFVPGKTVELVRRVEVKP